jgi:hypothetical protein
VETTDALMLIYFCAILLAFCVTSLTRGFLAGIGAAFLTALLPLIIAIWIIAVPFMYSSLFFEKRTEARILTGDILNWSKAVQERQWGLIQYQKEQWELMKTTHIGDLLIFYVNEPVGGVIGFGKLKEKKYFNLPFTTSSEKSQKIKDSSKLIFDIVYCLPENEWHIHQIPLLGYKGVYTDQKKINACRSKAYFQDIIDRANVKWGVEIIWKSKKSVPGNPAVSIVKKFLGFG